MRIAGVALLVAASYFAGASTPSAESQAVANAEQRMIRAAEQQAASLKQIAQAVRKLERCDR